MTMTPRGFAQIDLEEALKAEREPLAVESIGVVKPRVFSCSEDENKTIRNRVMIAVLLVTAIACLSFGSWRYVSYLNEERAVPPTPPGHVSTVHEVRLWKEPPLEEWPLRTLVIRNVGPAEEKDQTCIWLLEPNLVGVRPGTCEEDRVYSSFAWFPENGKIITFWYKQCLAVETIPAELQRRPEYCQGVQIDEIADFPTPPNSSQNLRERNPLKRDDTRAAQDIPPECLEEERMVVPLKNGTAVAMQDCAPNDPWQEWEYDPTLKLLRNRAAGTCLAFFDTIHMWECKVGDTHQQWKFEQQWQDRAELKRELPPRPELPRSADARSLFLPFFPFGDHQSALSTECPDAESTSLTQMLTYDPVQNLPKMSPAEQAHAESLQDVDVLWNKNVSSYGVEVGGANAWERAIVTKSNHSCIEEGDVVLAVNGRPASTGVHVRELIKSQGREPLRLRLHRKRWMEARLRYLEELATPRGNEEEEEDEEDEEEKKSSSNDSSDNSSKAEEVEIAAYNKLVRPGSSENVPQADPWQELRNFLTLQMGDRTVYTVGNEEGILFQYNPEKQDISIAIASETKFMGATLIMRLVELGYFGLDDLLSRWLPWWPTEPTDSRSHITVRHCISMTSGFYWIPDPRFNVQMDGRPERFNENSTINKYTVDEKMCEDMNEIRCAQEVLNASQHIAPPGVLWTYTGDHLRLVVAVMVTATGSDYDTLWRRHIFSRTSPPMVVTKHYDQLHYWDPAAEVYSTPRDLQAFLSAYYNGKLISEFSQRILETESIRDARIRWFLGASRPARPHGMANFAFDVWMSNPVLYKEQTSQTWCGQGQNCIFAPSFFNSVLAVERLDWPTFTARNCTWNYTKTCAFYFHLQNVVEDSSWENNKRCKWVSAQAEEAILNIMQGKKWKAPPIRYNF